MTGKAGDDLVFVRQQLTDAELRKFRLLFGVAILLLAAMPFLPWLLRGRPIQLGSDDVVMGLMMLALLLWVPVALRMDRTGRLTIGSSGLRYECDLPRWLRRVQDPNWSARWDEVKDARLFKRASTLALVIKGHALTRRLELLGWIPAAEASSNTAPRSTKLDESPVWRELLARGMAAGLPAPRDIPLLDFDMWAHPATRAALVASAVLFGAGIVAISSEGEAYIADGYGFLVPHVVAGIAGFLGFWLLLARARQPAKVPWEISPVVAVLGGVATGMLSYGGLVLVNKAVAPAVPASYSMESCTTLVPKDQDLPRIIWTSGVSDYWCQFKPGTEFVIPVRKGLLGSYQFDQGHYVELARAWRDAQRRKTKQRK